MRLRNLFKPRMAAGSVAEADERYALPDAADQARRAALLQGDPCAAISLTPHSMPCKLGQSLRMVLGHTATEHLPAEMNNLLKLLD